MSLEILEITNDCVTSKDIESLKLQLPNTEIICSSDVYDDPNVKILTQTKTVYEDTRYKAKLRLYNYITFKRNGLEVPRYTPFKGTEIGKNIPILGNS